MGEEHWKAGSGGVESGGKFFHTHRLSPSSSIIMANFYPKLFYFFPSSCLTQFSHLQIMKSIVSHRQFFHVKTMDASAILNLFLCDLCTTTSSLFE